MSGGSVRPILLDLFCGAGGAALGYYRAGFDVIGVDNQTQPRYPFRFIQDDAFDYLGIRGNLWGVAIIHASPPCQRYTALRTREDLSNYPDYIGALRAELERAGRPWIMENVPGAPLRADATLCGAMFGLRVYRHRLFECSEPVLAPFHPKHLVRVNRRGENRREHWNRGGFLTVTGDIGSYVGPEGMGIDWMSGNELREAIPPAYTEWIGKQLMHRMSAAGA